ncbi:MAG: DUF2892 domain-containing protein [Nitrospiraceae bacterium]
MVCNVGNIERSIRIVLGVVLLALGAFAGLPTGWAIAAFVLGAVALVTGVVRFCPAWMLLGINTCEVRTQAKRKGVA